MWDSRTTGLYTRGGRDAIFSLFLFHSQGGYTGKIRSNRSQLGDGANSASAFACSFNSRDYGSIIFARLDYHLLAVGQASKPVSRIVLPIHRTDPITASK